MVRFVRWLRAGAKSLAQRVPRRRLKRAAAPAAPDSDHLILAFAQLCRALDRPFAPAEIRAAAPAADGAIGVGGILLAARRLGFKARALKPSRHNLANAPAPFLVVGRVPGDVWLATERLRDHLVLAEPDAERVAACGFETVADLAERIVLLKPLAEPAPHPACRDTIMARLRPVLWELGIASVVINLLALATPLFLMTVTTRQAAHPVVSHPLPHCTLIA
jgi:ABC-type bacteriocin/lantibiotic exporter with double-glycine peptidase domain